MDGYALGESTKGNKWKIVGESFPGKPFNDLLKKGEAVTISTGSFVPDNCFYVIPQEQVSLELLNEMCIFLKKKNHLITLGLEKKMIKYLKVKY